MRLRAESLCILSILWVSAAAWSADWPGFRGAGGSGVSDQRGLPTQWSAEENLAWKVKTPGPGASSPITWGDKVFLTCYSGYGTSTSASGDPANLRRHVLCLRLTDGATLWERTLEGAASTEYSGFVTRHGYASSTPATDGERLYVFFGTEGVLAFDLEGRQLWQTSVGSGTHQWESATSPVLYKNLVVINASVESQSLVALDRVTGREVWRAPGVERSWNTPLLVDVPGGRQELVVSVKGSLLAFDPNTGKSLWRCDGIQDYVCPSAVAKDGVVYATGGRRNDFLAVKAGGRGDVTETHTLWRQQAGSNVSSPVVHGDYLFLLNFKGIAYCLNRSDGEIVYEERLPGGGADIYASAVAADGKIYGVSRQDGAFVVAARPEFELLAQNDLSPDASIFNGSPAISGPRLLLRSDQFLYCIGTP